MLDEAGARLEKANLSKTCRDTSTHIPAMDTTCWGRSRYKPSHAPGHTELREQLCLSECHVCCGWAGPPWFLSLKNETKQANVLPLDLQ